MHRDHGGPLLVTPPSCNAGSTNALICRSGIRCSSQWSLCLIGMRSMNWSETSDEKCPTLHRSYGQQKGNCQESWTWHRHLDEGLLRNQQRVNRNIVQIERVLGSEDKDEIQKHGKLLWKHNKSPPRKKRAIGAVG